MEAGRPRAAHPCQRLLLPPLRARLPSNHYNLAWNQALTSKDRELDPKKEAKKDQKP